MIYLRSGTVLSTQQGAGLYPTVAAKPATLLIATHGDSISRDREYNNYAYVLRSLINDNPDACAVIRPRGINGISWDYRWGGEQYTATMTEDGEQVDSGLRDDIPCWLVLFAGTNGMALGSHSAATEYADFKSYLDDRIAAGWVADRVIVCTMLPRTSFNDATRTAYNNSLVEDDGAYGYRIAPLHLDASIGAAGQNTDTDYFYDGTHLTAAGHEIVAQITYDAMFP